LVPPWSLDRCLGLLYIDVHVVGSYDLERTIMWQEITRRYDLERTVMWQEITRKSIVSTKDSNAARKPIVYIWNRSKGACSMRR
jgi:hypothetical protein